MCFGLPEDTDTSRASRVFAPPTWRSSLSIQNIGECKATSVLVRYWCRQTGLLKEKARMYKQVTASQGVPTATWHTRGTLEMVMDYFNLEGKQVIWIWNYFSKFPFSFYVKCLPGLLKESPDWSVVSWSLSRWGCLPNFSPAEVLSTPYHLPTTHNQMVS